MNYNELKSKVESNPQIPVDSYSLNGGLPNEALCIAKRGERWEVYYSERGNKSSLRSFQTETDACEYFYNYLLKMLNVK